MSGGFILAALGVAAAAYTGRYLMRNRQLIKKAIGSLPPPPQMDIFSKYERGGFAAQMTKMEAAKILGVPMSAKMERIRAAHKRVMIANHPDRGGSPYLASKINEAKDCLESQRF